MYVCDDFNIHCIINTEKGKHFNKLHNYHTACQKQNHINKFQANVYHFNWYIVFDQNQLYQQNDLNNQMLNMHDTHELEFYQNGKN
jgi:hypothetical protein